MNRKNIVINLLLALMVFGFTSCYDEEMDVPPVNVPTVNFSATYTIKQFKEKFKPKDLYYAVLNIGDSIKGDSLIPNVIIKGKVVSSDETGNIYKSIYIQDDSAGIQISINKSGLFNNFSIGQTIYIKCNGLYCGNYGSAMQIGFLYDGGIGRMSEIQMNKHIFKDGIPSNIPNPIKVKISQLNSNYNGMYISVDSLDFRTDTNRVWSEATSTTNRYAYDPQGSKLTIRTSQYATFRAEKTPKGLVSVKGIFTKYQSNATSAVDYQVQILNPSEVKKL